MIRRPSGNVWSTNPHLFLYQIQGNSLELFFIPIIVSDVIEWCNQHAVHFAVYWEVLVRCETHVSVFGVVLDFLLVVFPFVAAVTANLAIAVIFWILGGGFFYLYFFDMPLPFSLFYAVVLLWFFLRVDKLPLFFFSFIDGYTVPVLVSFEMLNRVCFVLPWPPLPYWPAPDFSCVLEAVWEKDFFLAEIWWERRLSVDSILGWSAMKARNKIRGVGKWRALLRDGRWRVHCSMLCELVLYYYNNQLCVWSADSNGSWNELF